MPLQSSHLLSRLKKVLQEKEKKNDKRKPHFRLQAFHKKQFKKQICREVTALTASKHCRLGGAPRLISLLCPGSQAWCGKS